MQQPFILGIDIGTGSTKAVAVNYSGDAFETTQYFYPTHHPQPGYSEQDPGLIWNAFVSAMNEIIKMVGYAPVAVSLSSVMHSVIPVDNNGQALYPMITWVDARSASIAENMLQDAGAESLYRQTGTPIYAMSPLSKIKWLRIHEPSIFQTTYKFISIKEYIWYRLFHVFEVDHSVASGTGLLDIDSLKWNDDALKLAGITAAHLSLPVSSGFIRYRADVETRGLYGITTDTAFVMGGSDGCLANLGSLAIQEGVAAITIGTSGAVRMASATPIFNFDAMTFNYRLDEERFICGGPVNNGGIVMQWLLKNLRGSSELTTEDYIALFKKIDLVPAGAEGLVFLPYLTGERAPVWDTKSTGVFFGVRLHHGTDHFSRAVLEGICFGLNQVLQALETAAHIERVHVSGGFVTSRSWVQMLADITGKEMVIVQAEDASAIGAAMLAMKQLKIVDNYEVFLKERTPESIQPRQEIHEIYIKIFQVYKQLYQPLKGAMHQLQQLNS